MSKWPIAAILAGCGRLGFESPSGDSLVDARAADGLVADVALDAPTIYSTAFAYWKLDDGAGTTAIDSTGNGHTMMLVNAPTWTTGMFGTAVTAAGTTDYLVGPALDLSSTQAITIAVWARRTYTVGPRHTLFELSADFNGVTTGLGLFPDDSTTCFGGNIMLGLRGNGGYHMTCYPQPSSGAWHRLVAVYDKSRPGGEEAALYIDGVLQTPAATPAPNDNTDAFGVEPFYVFARGGIDEFNPGDVDEIVIFARALTPAEIAQL